MITSFPPPDYSEHSMNTLSMHVEQYAKNANISCISARQVGEAQFLQSNFLIAAVWQVKQPVHVISTLSQPGATASVLRRQTDGSHTHMLCPSAIATYVKHMGGVDLGNQLCKYYSVRLKSTKHYKYYVFDVCIITAYILSGFVPASNISLEQERLKSFCVCLPKALVGDYNSRQRGRRSGTPVVTRPQAVPYFPTPHHHPRRRCEYCRAYRYRHPPCRRVCGNVCLTGGDDGSDCWSLWHLEE